MVVADVNPFQYVLSRRIVGGKFNKWIVILQEFDLDFQFAKSKKSLVFAEIIVEFPIEEDVAIEEDSFPNEHIFFISTLIPSMEIYKYISVPGVRGGYQEDMLIWK